MTVAQLIAKLENFPPDAKVGFAYPSGDYWKSILVGEVRRVEEAETRYSEYHQTAQLLSDSDEEASEGFDMVVLR